MENRWEKVEIVAGSIFLSSKITVDSDCSLEIKRHLLLGSDKPIKKQRHLFTEKNPYSQSYDFSSSHVQMWELDLKDGWAPKDWCFWTVMLEKTLENLLECKEIKPANLKGNELWIFTGGTDAEAPVLWSHDAKNWLTGKYPGAGKDWRWEKKGMTEDEMVGGHHRLNEHKFE